MSHCALFPDIKLELSAQVLNIVVSSFFCVANFNIICLLNTHKLTSTQVGVI